MKSAKKHFETFPEPYNTQAIQNTDELRLNHLYETATSALCWSFTWMNTPQGASYWGNFCETLRKGQ